MSNDPQTPLAPPPPAAAPKRRRRGRLVLVLGLALLLPAIGGGAYWYLAARPASAGAAESEPEPETPHGIVPLDPFVVNLADASGSRFLRVNLSLVTPDEASATVLVDDAVARMQVRSAILELLAQQTGDALITPDGKTALKKAIADRVGGTAGGVQVADVLFSEFVVQF